MRDAEKLAGIFRLFSVAARIRVVRALKRRAMCVTELTSQLGISQEATSQHLRVLRDASTCKEQEELRDGRKLEAEGVLPQPFLLAHNMWAPGL